MRRRGSGPGVRASAIPASNRSRGIAEPELDEHALGAELVELVETGKANRQTRRMVNAMRRRGSR